jgi:quercetin dioxygenase-like cupin family protein
MTIEIVRFGVGNRRPQGPPGTIGLSGTPITADARGLIAELAFARGSRIEPHSNPNTTWFVVVEGGGWVQVGEETARVAAGEAVLWPPDVIHGAWTEHGEMRAFVVEFAVAPGSVGTGVIEGETTPLLDTPAARGEGSLRDDDRAARDYDPTEGEPR